MFRSADLRIAGKSFTLIGTPEGDEFKDPSSMPYYLLILVSVLRILSELEFLPDVVNDLDVDFADNPAAAAVYKNDQRNIRKVKEATEQLQINIIHPLREGKRLLVLDIDYSKTVPLSPFSLSVNLMQLYWTPNR
jgi:ubiquitin-like domain-containing CTD phosphatase 1